MNTMPRDPWAGMPKGSVVHCEIDLDRLMLPEYQVIWDRKVSHKIINNFRPERCEPIHVNVRETGELPIVDGKHRVDGMTKQQQPIRRWRAIVHVGLSYAEENELFAALNRDKRTPMAQEKFWTAVAAGDAGMNDLKQIVEAIGFTIAPLGAGGTTRGIRAIGALVHCYTERRRYFAPALRMLAKAYGTEVAPDHGEIRSITAFYSKYHGTFDEQVLHRAMTKMPRSVWERNANLHRREHHNSNEEAFGQVLVRAYNGEIRRRALRLPNWLDVGRASDDAE